jgi:hypothetical protein
LPRYRQSIRHAIMNIMAVMSLVPGRRRKHYGKHRPRPVEPWRIH